MTRDHRPSSEGPLTRQSVKRQPRKWGRSKVRQEESGWEGELKYRLAGFVDDNALGRITIGGRDVMDEIVFDDDQKIGAVIVSEDFDGDRTIEVLSFSDMYDLGTTIASVLNSYKWKSIQIVVADEPIDSEDFS